MNELTAVSLVECPRDAMQGWKTFIPTVKKIEYLNSLLQVGFHTLDCGSFVSPKAIPQMADTKQVLSQLSIGDSKTKLLVIVANERGAEEAVELSEVTYLGFPFSISPTFQRRNTNSTLDESVKKVKHIRELCIQHKKELVVYMSMAFGNPYGDDYSEDILMRWTGVMVDMGVEIISLADTVGVANPHQVSSALGTLIPGYANAEIGVHLHSTAANWMPKLAAAVYAGCKRFDGAVKGIGGCPMANDELIGNMNTELMLSYFDEVGILPSLNMDALHKSIQIAEEIFI